jgi:hypothetical protein
VKIAGLLTAVWAVGGWLAWSFKLSPGIAKATLVFALTTWPAAGAAKVLQGLGWGENVRPGTVPSAFLCFGLWALVLWAPLLASRSRRFPLWCFFALEAALLTATAVLFFSFGNG